jgi:2-polyprenyl-3-methyl-5-hydroxy-6-metoxy-1,4-benzoquinol methylase
MTIDPLSDAKIVDSWSHNVAPWISAVREGAIASRTLATDRAMVETLLEARPQRVLDLGCGEGWLARALARRGIHVIGTDAIGELIEAARRLGGGDYRTLSYEAISTGELQVKADAIACNFSLLGKESVDALLATLPNLLEINGRLVIQTLHPLMASGEQPYRDGWRHGSWTGFSQDFSDPAPWYFRTLQSWMRLIVDSGFALREIREPLDPRSGKPASVIFIAQHAEDHSHG